MGRIKTLIFIVTGLLLIILIIPNVIYNETAPLGLLIILIGAFIALLPVFGKVIKKFSHRWFKRLAIAGYGLLLCCLAVMAVLTVIMVSASRDDPKNIPENADVIVPGCLLQGDKPGEMLQNRLDAAYAYLNAHKNSLCVVCGGYIGKHTQAEIMKEYLTQKGIAASRILADDKSDTTYENIKNAKDLLDGKRNVVIITDVFHEYRSKFYAKLLGLYPYAYPSVTPARHYIDAWPREYLAVIKAWIFKV